MAWPTVRRRRRCLVAILIMMVRSIYLILACSARFLDLTRGIRVLMPGWILMGMEPSILKTFFYWQHAMAVSRSEGTEHEVVGKGRLFPYANPRLGYH